MARWCWAAAAAAVGLLAGWPGGEAADPSPRERDEQAIRAASQAYMQAVKQGDLAAAAALWMPDGDIIDAAGNRIAAGEIAVGPAAAGFEGDPDHNPGEAGDSATPPAADAVADTGVEYRVAETTIRFLGPDTAIEDGTVEIVAAVGPPLVGRFSATWVRQDGGWKLAAVREASGSEAAGGPVALADLEWMVGDWIVVDDPEAPRDPGDPVVEVSTRWNEQKTFLMRELTVTRAADEPPTRISQRIGWDPLAKAIHSWKFGSDGTHGEAIWRRDGRAWVAEAHTVGPDGSQASSINVYVYDGKDRCTWQSLPADIGGARVPPVSLTMIRKDAAGGDATNDGDATRNGRTR